MYLYTTGAQDLHVLGEILCHLASEYAGRGFTVDRRAGSEPPGFVGDVGREHLEFPPPPNVSWMWSLQTFISD